MDSQTKRAIDKLTKELARTQDELARVKRGSRRPQLAHSSIDSGALEVRDSAGVTRLRLGWQPDGSVGSIVEGGDPPPEPSAPTVSPMASGLYVGWDGDLASGGPLPADFDHVNVYASQVDGFTPSLETFQGTIHRDGGRLPVAPLDIGQTYYVVLVGVGTGGVRGEPSAQSSGVPESVTDIEPGSITETEIADDAISTPKIQAEAVQALHIAAEQIQAGHIQAAAITAAKLEADLVLGTRIVAGNPSGARVELDQRGLRGYSTDDELVFVLDDDGNATFSGQIVGSEITGSRMTIGSPPGAAGVIDESDGVVNVRVAAAGGERAQLVARQGQAEFTAWSDSQSPTSPAGGMTAMPVGVNLAMYSDVGNLASAPRTVMGASSGSAVATWTGGDGSQVRVVAFPDWSALTVLPPESTTGEPQASPGYVYGFRRGTNDAPTLSMQSPYIEDDEGGHRRSLIHVEATSAGQPHTVIRQSAHRIFFQDELVEGQTDNESDGQVHIASTHSLSASRHRPLRTYMQSEPGWGTRGEYVDFTAAEMAPIEFRTSWSGWTRITITGAGFHNFSATTNVRIAFRLDGPNVYSANPQRLWYATNNGVGSTGRIHSSRVVYMSISGNSDYVLTPQWYATVGGTASNVNLWESLENSIIVECLT